MSLVCTECYTRYQIGPEEHMHWCPRLGCDGEVVDVDDLILDSIMTLWHKGYETMYCCSGHITELSFHSYIKFADGCVPPELPKGYSVNGDYSTVIERNVDQSLWRRYPYPRRIEVLTESVISIYEWATDIRSLSYFQNQKKV